MFDKYGTDGFNERTNYILNGNNGPLIGQDEQDSSFAQMRVDENRNKVETYNEEKSNYISEAKGEKQNFVVQNFNVLHANKKPSSNIVSDTINRNRFNSINRFNDK